MRAVILVDNLTHSDLTPEWGLSVYIEYNGHKILLDTGASGLFAENAAALGIDLTQVELGVLSHAHFDHADGMGVFFERNDHAPFYLRASCGEFCYDKEEEGYHYEGIQKGLLAQYDNRLRYVEGTVSPLPGVYLLPHTTPGLEKLGEKAGMYLLQPDGSFLPDDFRHEQSLVFETERGLVIFNSCSHAGADNIVKEVAAAFPGKPIYAIAGGFHLFATPSHEVRAFAERLRDTGVQRVITGHCTGEEAYGILAEVLGDKAQQIYTGLTLDL